MSQNSNWIYQPVPAPEAKFILFCFHFAGGSAQIFRNWGNAMQQVAEIRAIQLPGRGNRFQERLYTRVQNIIDDLYPILAGQLERPFAIFGHSLGGIIAFELARKLVATNSKMPKALYLASRVAPEVRPISLLSSIKDDEEFLAAIARRYGPSPGMAVMKDPEMRALFLPSLRADIDLFDTYEYTGHDLFEFPIFTMRGRQDTGVSADGIVGWNKYTKVDYAYREFDGGHFFWQNNEHELLQYLKSSLDKLA